MWAAKAIEFRSRVISAWRAFAAESFASSWGRIVFASSPGFALFPVLFCRLRRGAEVRSAVSTLSFILSSLFIVGRNYQRALTPYGVQSINRWLLVLNSWSVFQVVFERSFS